MSERCSICRLGEQLLRETTVNELQISMVESTIESRESLRKESREESLVLSEEENRMWLRKKPLYTTSHWHMGRTQFVTGVTVKCYILLYILRIEIDTAVPLTRHREKSVSVGDVNARS